MFAFAGFGDSGAVVTLRSFFDEVFCFGLGVEVFDDFVGAVILDAPLLDGLLRLGIFIDREDQIGRIGFFLVCPVCSSCACVLFYDRTKEAFEKGLLSVFSVSFFFLFHSNVFRESFISIRATFLESIRLTRISVRIMMI